MSCFIIHIGFSRGYITHIHIAVEHSIVKKHTYHEWGSEHGANKTQRNSSNTKKNFFFCSPLNEFKAKINKAISYWLSSSDLPSCTVHCIFMYFICSFDENFKTRCMCQLLCRFQYQTSTNTRKTWNITFEQNEYILKRNVDHIKSKRLLYQFPYRNEHDGCCEWRKHQWDHVKSIYISFGIRLWNFSNFLMNKIDYPFFPSKTKKKLFFLFYNIMRAYIHLAEFTNKFGW